MKKDLECFDISEMSADNRKILHRMLYRQECRVWLLAGGFLTIILLLISELETNSSEFEQLLVKWVAAILSVILAFWVGIPTQRILTLLRKEGEAAETQQIERRFDNTLQSLWDFGPPLVLPMMLYLVLIAYRLLIALQGP